MRREAGLSLLINRAIDRPDAPLADEAIRDSLAIEALLTDLPSADA